MTLVESVETAAEAMTWLKPSDKATVELAKSYAARIDAAIAAGDETEAAKAMYLGPHLLNTLKALGGAPAERKALGVEEEAHGKLAQLRAIRGGAAS